MTEPMHCVNHPDVETYLRCNKCGQPICPKCVVQTPVGYRCRDCVNAQQRVFYADFRPVHYLVAAAVALPLALVAGWLIPSLGWFAIFLGPLVGGGIAEAAYRAIQRRRGRYTWLVVCGCIAVGVLPKLLLTLLTFIGPVVDPTAAGYYITSGLMGLLWAVVYLVAAVGAAYARLRPGRRV
ncbi:MAG: B-box zinc finger protein [Chloroflexi bacterium]|nr:B-box zinc finger protein [Chloroflexota bacterium]